MIETSEEFLCKKCTEPKKRSDFVKDHSRPNGLYPWCKSCHKLAQVSYKKKRPNGVDGGKCETCSAFMGKVHPNRRFCSPRCKDRSKRWSLFGLTPSDYAVLTASERCPICDKKPKRWSIDHN